MISFDILIVSQSGGNFGNVAVSPWTCPRPGSHLSEAGPGPRTAAAVLYLLFPLTWGEARVSGMCACPARPASLKQIGPDCCHFRSLWRLGSGGCGLMLIIATFQKLLDFVRASHPIPVQPRPDPFNPPPPPPPTPHGVQSS